MSADRFGMCCFRCGALYGAFKWPEACPQCGAINPGDPEASGA